MHYRKCLKEIRAIGQHDRETASYRAVAVFDDGRRADILLCAPYRDIPVDMDALDQRGLFSVPMSIWDTKTGAKYDHLDIRSFEPPSVVSGRPRRAA